MTEICHSPEIRTGHRKAPRLELVEKVSRLNQLTIKAYHESLIGGKASANSLAGGRISTDSFSTGSASLSGSSKAQTLRTYRGLEWEAVSREYHLNDWKRDASAEPLQTSILGRWALFHNWANLRMWNCARTYDISWSGLRN